MSTLVWTNPVDADFSGVIIRRKTTGFPSSRTDGDEIYNGIGVSVIDDNVTNGVTYYYAAYAYDDVPNYASGTVASAQPVGPPDVTAPSNVSGIAALAGDRRVRLLWTNPPEHDFQGVKILRKTSGCSSSPTDGVLAYQGNATEFVDLGVVNGTAYCYTIFSYDEVPNYSSGVTATATPFGVADTLAPDEVTGLVALPGPGVVQLAWLNPVNNDWIGNRVVRKIGSAPLNSNDGILVFDGQANSTLDSGLTNGVIYFYRVFTYDATLNISNGVVVSATPLASLPIPVGVCNDSDGGKNYFVQGTVTTPGPVSSDDTCVDTQTLEEKFCATPFVAGNEYVGCAAGFQCADGRCVATIPLVPPVCGNSLCEAGENSLNCVADCPAMPQVPPVNGGDGRRAELLRAVDVQFYATVGKLPLRTSNDARTQSGNEVVLYPAMTFTVSIPSSSVRKPIQSAFINLVNSTYAMRQSVGYEAVVTSAATLGSYPLQLLCSTLTVQMTWWILWWTCSRLARCFEVVKRRAGG